MSVSTPIRGPYGRRLQTARDEPATIAAFPSGVEESKLERGFPGIARIGEAVDVLCKFSLIVPVLLRDVAGTCGVCGSYPVGW